VLSWNPQTDSRPAYDTDSDAVAVVATRLPDLRLPTVVRDARVLPTVLLGQCRGQLASGTDSVSEVQGTLLRFELKNDAAVRGFDALAEKLIAAVRAAEPETLVYVFHAVEDAPLSRVVYEVFANQDAAERHGSTDYFQRAMVELDQYVVSARMETLGAPHGKLLADTLGTT
jgi:quinol monooxygenase YgiN